ncbi:RlpA-like double-psi beta-barrel-protein domain-containing protein-containing protein [Hypoxylon trugodes]|uniref:RlpA-like double-psi beta-barrel-protein domain-containing protein-containing protein n=1 Tax=Hypoxylon trugodes TaxID=326681 RepID=UPI00219F7E99|nr:RlpA-like double-psi beta-barrel-protein domain-containing protein-containing protein [Hypoxylon trugodes]KAI1382648.1 RlpA-like double-psi beta-barrel-protein domain-containing protein-containing protein [Hypoxylon trugodes]
MYSITKVVIALGALIAPSIAFSGDMTYYTPGLGSCGETNSEGDAVVALSSSQTGHCNKNINIHYNGQTASAKVVDTCPGCGGDGIDVSPTVFKELANLDQGRVSVTWEFA